jgi:hypothetical protein
MNNKYIDKMIGFKATNADMTCKGHKFEIGKWYEIEGEVEMCNRGWHFCSHPSGVYSYNNAPDVRVFRVEAEQVLIVPTEAGADFKLVAKRIRLVEEVTPGKDGNDVSNTGDKNTGDKNTGYSNTGDRNAGDTNTGDKNTGYSNTGDRNAGHRNTGDWNTGDWNTGDWNTGYRNTGNWNATRRSAGFFCAQEPFVISFDVPTQMTHEKFLEKYPESHKLGELLVKPEPIPFDEFEKIPGITRAKLLALHQKHLEAR